MWTTTRALSPLSHYTILKISIEGIWRQVHCFVTSQECTSLTGIVDLLLGLPWMYDIDATIAIWEAAIYVGDS